MMYDYVHLTNKIKWPPCSQKIARLLPSWRFTTKDPVESLANLVYHMMRAYYLTMHWKAAAQRISKSRYWLISSIVVGSLSLVHYVCQLNASQEDQQPTLSA